MNFPFQVSQKEQIKAPAQFENPFLIFTFFFEGKNLRWWNCPTLNDYLKAMDRMNENAWDRLVYFCKHDHAFIFQGLLCSNFFILHQLFWHHERLKILSAQAELVIQDNLFERGTSLVFWLILHVTQQTMKCSLPVSARKK